MPRLRCARNCVRQPVLSAPPTAPESSIERTQSGTERRDRTTPGAILTAVQNGTSGVLAACKQATHWVPWDTLRTGIMGHDPSSITDLVVQSPDTSAQGSQGVCLGQELEGR